jgi:hypothetical protein
MTRGRRPSTGLDGAIEIAKMKGTVIKFLLQQETAFSFLIQTLTSIIFVRIHYKNRLHASIQEIETEFHELIARLRLLPASEVVVRQLWLYSRRGVWRYFVITDTGIEEIGVDGLPAGAPKERSVTGAGGIVREKAEVTTVQT